MSILTRYVAWAFLRNLALTLLALLALVQVANFFARIEEVFSGWSALLRFLDGALRGTPFIIETVLPIVVLLGALFTLVGLSRGSELTAMKTSGTGPLRLLTPFVIVLVPVAALGYLNQNYLHAWLNPAGLEEQTDRHVWRRLNDTLFYFQAIDRDRHTLTNARTFQFNEGPFRLARVERIGRGSRETAGWRMEDVTRRDLAGVQPEVQHISQLEQKADTLPQIFRAQIADPRHMPFWRLYQEIQRIQKEGGRVAIYILEWYQKPAAMFALGVMGLLGVALAQSSPRRGRAGLESGLTILLGVMFWLSSEIAFLLGKGDLIPVLVSVWGPSLFFFGLASILYQRMF
jgi:LPS export ABC transporter permease LptG